ncbi:hypothetical protein [Candidatus Neptunochlamydia vexilliferae]|uniref:hypothetical protein n=1 Tax=Candidatus Neptunichlamydia vexilliferae TaxID=1651774 RepID=UPI001891CDF1|nr:hypothetical protein [Candidatus Neptunochlamydia vexilliferae]
MSTSSWLTFESLLTRGGEEKKSVFLRYLTPQEQAKLNAFPPPRTDPLSHPYSMEERVGGIHYSWLIPFLEPFGESDKSLILSALEKTPAQKLQNHFKTSLTLSPLKPPAKNYLLSAIYCWLNADQKEFLPLEFLPDHPLNAILSLSKKELQTLVDYLGLHDLAIELKHVIKAEQIKKIQKVLSQKEQEYLKNLLKTKEPLSFSRLNLDGWGGDEEELKSILHHRGFNRLGKALFGCHPSLLWHICHKLDTGRANILKKFFIDIKNEQAHQALIQQTLGLIT